MVDKYSLDTSDTHKYGEIWIANERGEIILTVHPIDGDEDSPNYNFAKKICHLMNEGLL